METITDKKSSFEIIDFHIHPFNTSENNTCFYEKTTETLEDISKDLMRAGISRACGSVIKRVPGDNFEDIVKLNDEAVSLREKLREFYIPGIHIHPRFVKESCEELKRMHDKGVRLVGELVPYFMGWKDYYDNNIHEIFEYIEKLEMIVNVHTQSEDTLEMAVKTFPNIIFVAAHPGEKNTYLNHLERMKKYENYYLDLSGTGIFRYGSIAYGVSKVGSERFLFGTDYPICNPGMYVQAVLYERLKDKDYEAIFSENAKRLLKL
jgi:predicted TIM-barrel fold metal-dependent hydrolase